MEVETEKVDCSAKIVSAQNMGAFAMLVILLLFRNSWTMDLALVLGAGLLVVSLIVLYIVNDSDSILPILLSFVICTATAAPAYVNSLWHSATVTLNGDSGGRVGLMILSGSVIIVTSTIIVIIGSMLEIAKKKYVFSLGIVLRAFAIVSIALYVASSMVMIVK
ncbi:MAG: hypothetical protein AAB575_00745 [Patescibacteria group bacterium]